MNHVTLKELGDLTPQEQAWIDDGFGPMDIQYQRLCAKDRKTRHQQFYKNATANRFIEAVMKSAEGTDVDIEHEVRGAWGSIYVDFYIYGECVCQIRFSDHDAIANKGLDMSIDGVSDNTLRDAYVLVVERTGLNLKRNIASAK